MNANRVGIKGHVLQLRKSICWSRLLPFLLIPFALTAFVPSSTAQTPPNHPNIIVILADDLGYGDVSFNGCPYYSTPNIDSLASTGLWCSNGYVTAGICCPSRAALLTGRYHQRYGVENEPNDVDTDPLVGLPMQELLLPQILKPAGYVCGLIGRWHLGSAPNFRPLQRGFDEYFGFLGATSQYFNAPLLQNNTPITETAYLTDAFTREGVSFINRHATEPFFLFLAYNAPHPPFQAPQSYLDRVPSNVTDPQLRTYAAMVIAVDDGVGQVLQTLQAQNLLNNTLIFFLSDNGSPGTPGRNLPLRGSHFDFLEGGIRVPFAVQWTGHLPAPGIYNQPISSLDIVPTAAALAGVPLPSDRDYDGLNIIPYLTGQQSSPQRTLFWRWFGLGPTGPPGSVPTIYAVRSGPLKLVTERGREDQPELYNLPNDIHEDNDLSTTQPGDVDALKQLYAQWNTELIAPLWKGHSNWPVGSLILAGDWNSNNINDSTHPWNLTRVNAPGAQGTPDGWDWFTNTIHVATTGGDTTPGAHSFVLTAGDYADQWGGVAVNIDDATTIPFYSGSALGPTNTISFEDGFYYSFRILNYRVLFNSPLKIAVMKTSAPPVSVSISGQTPTSPTPNDSVVINIVASQPKSPEEHIYLRWSTDSFITSQMVEAVGAGVNYTATIPAQPAGTPVQYCLTTSTADLSSVVASGTIDALTLSTSVKPKFVVSAGAPTPTPTPTATPTPSATPTPTPTPTPTSTPTPTPTPTPPGTAGLSGLTYNGGAFVNGTNLTYGQTYTVTAQANTSTQSVVFSRDGAVVKTDSGSPFDFTWTPTSIGTHTFVAAPWSSPAGKGSSGASITVSFNVVKASPTPTPTPTP